MAATRPMAGDAESRKKWSIAFAALLIKESSADALKAMVAGGEDLFTGYCKRELRQHGFKEDDYHRIYTLVSQAADLTPIAARDFVRRVVINAATGG